MFYCLKWCPRVFPHPSLFSELWRFPGFCDLKYFANPSTPPAFPPLPDAAQRWRVSSICLAVGVPLLQLSPSSIPACSNGLHAVCTSRDASPVSPTTPPPHTPVRPLFSAIPTTTSQWDLQLFYLLASDEWKPGAHQHLRSTEKVNVAVLNLPKTQEEKSPPLQRARQWGREWAKPESSGALPKPLGACDRSLIYPSTREIGSMCLFHSWTVSDSNSYLCRDAIKHVKI